MLVVKIPADKTANLITSPGIFHQILTGETKSNAIKQDNGHKIQTGTIMGITNKLTFYLREDFFQASFQSAGA